MWLHSAIKKVFLLMGFIGSIYLSNLSRDFPSFFWYYWQINIWYGIWWESSISSHARCRWLLPGHLAATGGTDKCPSLQIKSEWRLQRHLPRRKNNCFVVKIQNTSFSEREEHPPAVGTTCALKRWEIPALGTEISVHDSESQTHNSASKLAISC